MKLLMGVASGITAAAPILLCATLHAEEPAWSFASQATSPRPSRGSELDRDLEEVCGTPEGGLHTVAERLLERKARGLPYLDLDGLSFAQRVAGEPHVWPRAFILSTQKLDADSAKDKLRTWRASFGDVGERRCGLVTRTLADGTQVIAAMAVDALADLKPIPTRGRTGAWISVEATMLVPATSAEVFVMGPRGAPRTVPTSLSGNKVRARFPLSEPGAFVMQVLADVGAGPRPVLEANVYADVEPPARTPNLAAPGEQALAGKSGPAGLYAMVDALRESEGRAKLVRDPALEEVARAHALRMKEVSQVGHSLSDGDPNERVQNANILARRVGENVAHAENLVNAHRALYGSPSHRQNLIDPGWKAAGFAAVPGDDGSVWVCEVFVER
jgi:hypothetical protein